LKAPYPANKYQARKFAQRCFTPLELYSFQHVFRSLADHQDSIAYLKEDTLARFLEIPDILSVSAVLFQMVSYLGAFPFGQDAPVVLGFERMIMVIPSLQYTVNSNCSACCEYLSCLIPWKHFMRSPFAIL
jgi:hypothetical protein